MKKRRQVSRVTRIEFEREAPQPSNRRSSKKLPPDELLPWNSAPKERSFPRGTTLFEYVTKSGHWEIRVGTKGSKRSDQMGIGTIQTSNGTIKVKSPFFRHPIELLPGDTFANAKSVLLDLYKEEKRRYSTLPMNSSRIPIIRGGRKWNERGREGWNPS